MGAGGWERSARVAAHSRLKAWGVIGMTFICYIDRTNSDTPHMEPLSATSLTDAEIEAGALLQFYDSGHSARVYAGDALMVTISREEPLSAPA